MASSSCILPNRKQRLKFGFEAWTVAIILILNCLGSCNGYIEFINQTPGSINIPGGNIKGLLGRVRNSGVLNGKLIQTYFGVPYANATARRFMPAAQSTMSWDGYMVLIRRGAQCHFAGPGLEVSYMKRMLTPKFKIDRYVAMTTEATTQNADCLSLNVYKPQSRVTNALKPVMVLIAPIDYDYGLGSTVDPSGLAIFGDIVIVTINFRMGIFGFLSTADNQNALGNIGLSDIYTALRWVRTNIEGFGGDRERVTLMGHGHGAALVDIFINSPFVNSQFTAEEHGFGVG